MEQLKALLYEKEISLDDRQLHQFESYVHHLVEWNKKMNLTAITEKEEIVLKHFYDSISLSFFVPLHNVAKMIDVGSGAGFPSLPLKIVFPHLQVTIVDSLRKRIHFLEHVVQELGLANVNCVHGRAEDVGRDPEHRDQYDLVTARAVAKLHILNEICLPFANKNGLFVSMKGNNPNDEIAEAQKSLKLLNGVLQEVHRFHLPDEEQSTRHLIVIEKQAATPKKYPRKAGVPFKTPLV